MLTSKQRAYLRGLANKENAIFQIGKGGLTEKIISEIDYVVLSYKRESLVCEKFLLSHITSTVAPTVSS